MQRMIRLINVLVIVLFMACPFMVYMSGKRFLNIYETISFYTTNPSYAHLWEDVTYRKLSQEAKRYIPKGSKISIAYPSGGRNFKIALYEFAFEYQESSDWDYFVDFRNSIENPEGKF